MFQKFGATIVDEEKTKKPAVKATVAKPKVAPKTDSSAEDERPHYECFRF